MELLYEVKIYNLFLIFVYAVYNSSEWFESVAYLEFNLLTDINMRKAAKGIESLYLIDEFNKEQQGIKSRKYILKL